MASWQINSKLTLELPIAVVGMGSSGVSSKRLLTAAFSKSLPSTMAQMGVLLEFDDNPSRSEFSSPEDLMSHGQPKTLLISPGYPLSSPWVIAARKNGIRLVSELDLGLSFLNSEKLVGVTGSIGKSTTVSALGYILKKFDANCFIGGNLGIPLCDYIHESRFENRAQANWVLLELSSYQLELSDLLICEHSAITYLTANHLERYLSKNDYYQTKTTLFLKTLGAKIANKNGGDLVAYFNSKELSSSEASLVLKLDWVDRSRPSLKKYHFERSLLLGSHNQDNLAIAALLAEKIGIPSTTILEILSFPGLPHRLENCGLRAGVLFVNDSKSTTIQSVLDALSSVESGLAATNSIILLIGGRDKNLPWERLNTLREKATLKVISFGEFGPQALLKSGLSGKTFPTLAESIKYAKTIARSGDVVLLSPGGASQDEFKNFEDRGNFFKNEIEK